MKALERMLRDAGYDRADRRAIRRRMRTIKDSDNHGTRRVKRVQRHDGYDTLWSLGAMFFGLKAQPEFDPETGRVLEPDEGGEHDDDDAGVA